MLINPNLMTITKLSVEPLDSTHNYKVIDLPDNLEVGKKYVISCYSKYSTGDSGTFIIADKTKGNKKDDWCFCKDGVINKKSFIYNPDKTSQILFYAGHPTRTNNIFALYSMIKLEEEQATLYLPNENTLETPKRQYFIGGGYFKEVYPIS